MERSVEINRRGEKMRREKGRIRLKAVERRVERRAEI